MSLTVSTEAFLQNTATLIPACRTLKWTPSKSTRLQKHCLTLRICSLVHLPLSRSERLLMAVLTPLLHVLMELMARCTESGEMKNKTGSMVVPSTILTFQKGRQRGFTVETGMSRLSHLLAAQYSSLQQVLLTQVLEEMSQHLELSNLRSMWQRLAKLHLVQAMLHLCHLAWAHFIQVSLLGCLHIFATMVRPRKTLMDTVANGSQQEDSLLVTSLMLERFQKVAWQVPSQSLAKGIQPLAPNLSAGQPTMST